MIWQDVVITVGSWVFVVALIPTLRGKEKPAVTTSVVTGFILIAYALVYATLGMWVSVVSTTALALSWFTLAVQKIKKQ